MSRSPGMFTNKMTAFQKSETCPTSHELLSFQDGELAGGRSLEIRKHLALCEFCDAEVEIYSLFPLADIPNEPAKIPRPLYELAEALLKHRGADTSALSHLLKENDLMTLDGVH